MRGLGCVGVIKYRQRNSGDHGARAVRRRRERYSAAIDAMRGRPKRANSCTTTVTLKAAIQEPSLVGVVDVDGVGDLSEAHKFWGRMVAYGEPAPCPDAGISPNPGAARATLCP